MQRGNIKDLSQKISKARGVEPVDTKKSLLHLPKTRNEVEESRIYNLLSSTANSKVGDLLKKFEPIINVLSSILNVIMPIITTYWSYVYRLYNYLPMEILYALLGLGFVFFGGIYVLTIAAAETFYMTGWESCKQSYLYLKYEFDELWQKSREDDKKDEDKDGVADVLQISARELFTRKLAFFFSNCSDPQKFMDMLTAICSSLIGVIAVLKVNFAKTIALGASIGDELRKPAAYLLVPMVSKLVPSQYRQWIAPGINLLCKSIGITIAWFIQRIISSVHSAVRGGLLCSRQLLGYLHKKGYIYFNEEESYLDEILGWGLAAWGVYFQLVHLFNLPFPLNLILLPLNVVENYFLWIISS
jgi:hypothetical protein